MPEHVPRRIPKKRSAVPGRVLRYGIIPAAALGTAYAVAPAQFHNSAAAVLALSRYFGGNNTPPPPSTGSGSAGVEGVGNSDIGAVEMVIVGFVLTALAAVALARRGSQVA
jgi:hypothetical protein